MKRLLLSLAVALLTTGFAVAQNRDIRLPQKPQRTTYREHSGTNNDQGFWCAGELEVGSTVFIDDPNMQLVGLSYTAGYRLSEFLRVGAGIGGRYYVAGNDKLRDTSIKWTMPIYLHARGNIISQYSRSMVPYWAASIGGVVRDGFFIQPTIGLRFGELRDSWLIGLSYNLQHINAQKHRPETASGLLLKVGYEF